MCNVTHFSVFSIMCICVSISLCINQSVCLCLSVYKFFSPVCPSDIHPSSVYIFVYFCIQFICLSVYLPYSYQSIKSVCPLVSQSIYPLYFLYMSTSILHVSLQQLKLFSTVPNYRTSSGDMFCGRVGGVLVH